MKTNKRLQIETIWNNRFWETGNTKFSMILFDMPENRDLSDMDLPRLYILFCDGKIGDYIDLAWHFREDFPDTFFISQFEFRTFHLSDLETNIRNVERIHSLSIA